MYPSISDKNGSSGNEKSQKSHKIEPRRAHNPSPGTVAYRGKKTTEFKTDSKC